MKSRIPTTLRNGVISIAAVALFALAGCGGGGGSGTANEGPPKAGGTLTLAEIEEVQSFLPNRDGGSGETTIHMIGQIIEPLIRVNSKSEIEPWLAESYKESPDHLTWTFNLRDGVTFSNGQPLTAEDVVFSLEIVRNSPVWSFMFERIKAIRETSPKTVVIEMAKPDSALPAELSLYAAGIVPKDFGGLSEKEFGQKPIGTGPFTLAEWKHGESLTLASNPSYWRKGEPLLEKVVAHTVTNANSRVAQRRGGQLESIALPQFSQLESITQTPGLTVGRYSWALLNTVQLSSKSATFKDPRAREAFDLAIDRDAIVEAATSGYSKPAGSWVPSAVPDWNPNIKPTQQDIPKAQKLLDEAVADGADPSFTMVFAADNPYWLTTTQLMQQSLEEVGFDVTLRSIDISALTEQWLTGDWEAIAWSGGKPDIPDQSEFATFYVGTEALGTGAPTDEVKKVTDEARTTYDPEVRRQRYYEFQDILDKERFFITLDEQQFIWALKSNISGFNTNLTGKPTLAETGFTD